MTDFEWHSRPQIPRTASAVVRDALVPMLMWTSVPVIRRADQGLTIVDRFILEAALALDPMRPEDVEEVTQIPRDAVLRIAGRLAALGLLDPSDDGFYPAGDATRTALTERAVPQYVRAYLTFLYLPDGDDLIAFASGHGQTRAPLIERAEPVADVELPAEVGGRPLAHFIGARIRDLTVAQLPDDIVGASDDDTAMIPPTCPVYRCAGHVKQDGEGIRLALDIKSPTGKKEACSIPGAAGQARKWEAVATRAPEAAARWEGVIMTARESTTRGQFTLDALSASAAVREGVAISRPAGLWIPEPPSCVVEVEVAFEPSGPDAAIAFAVDHAVRELADTVHTALGQDAAEVAAAAGRRQYKLPEAALTGEDIAQRLWEMSYFRHVYALRESADFAYD